MTEQAFSSLVPEVATEVPGCPAPVIVSAIRRAAIEVCEKTLAWRHVQPPFTLSPGILEYEYVKPAASEIHTVFSAAMNGVPLELLTLEQALYKYPAWADAYSGQNPATLWGSTPSFPIGAQEFNEDTFNPTASIVLPEAVLADASEPRSITQITPDRFVVLPLPDSVQPYQIRMTYALKPTRTASGMSAAVLNEITEVVVHQALHRLYMTPNTAWQDQTLAAYHGNKARLGIVERRARANLTNLRGTLFVTALPFA